MNKFVVILILYVNLINQTAYCCTNPIYCHGRLLHTVQMAKIFNDSKTFVDMYLLNTPNVTLEKFNGLMQRTNQHPNREEVHEFVFENFKDVGELQEYYPPDFVVEPRLVREIENPVVRQFTKDLIAVWPSLGRIVSPDVLTNPDRYSLIPVKHGFIIPGGRFRELYYWDSYWIVKGLLLSDMFATAKGVIENLLYMVETYGFIPNGGRIYYLNRSHPPLLSLIMSEYYKYTNDFHFLRDNIHTLENELKFWLDKRIVQVERNGKKHYLAHFASDNTRILEDEDDCDEILEKKGTREKSSNFHTHRWSMTTSKDALSEWLLNRTNETDATKLINTLSFGIPRPESYIEDIKTCSFYIDENHKAKCYAEIQSGAESGWDFSSRWLFNKKGDVGLILKHIESRRVIPVDLNSFLCRAFKEMANFYVTLGDLRSADVWKKQADQWQTAIHEILYNEKDGIWHDFDIKLEKSRKVFYASNFAPLWAHCYNLDEQKEYGRRAAAYFIRQGIMDYPGGIPTSLVPSGEQWDFPNAWPPLQEIVIIGLKGTGDPDAENIAKTFATRWIESNIRAFLENHEMFEKYDSVHPGQYGGGGEYDVQSGFGWSNGAALSLINAFYRKPIKWRK